MRVCGIALVLLLSYVLTRPSSLSLVRGTDGGELTLVATTFGVAHPPGYGLYTLAAGVALRLLPGESAVQKMQLFSHFTAIALSLIVGIVASAHFSDRRRKAQAFTAAALLCGWSRPVWEQALMIEVYLTLALLLVIVMGLLTSYNTAHQDIDREDMARHVPTKFWTYLVIGHVFGLALTHHLTALLWLLGLLILAWPQRPFMHARQIWRRVLLQSLLFCAGCLSGLWSWLYLWGRGGQVAQANWGGLERGFTAVIAHITAQEYRVFLQPFTWEALGRGISRWILALPDQITPFGVLLFLIGLVTMTRTGKGRRWLAALIVWVVCVAGFTGLYRAPETQAAYTLPLMIPVVLITTTGLMRLIGFWPAVLRELWVWGVALLLFVSLAAAVDQKQDVTGVNFLAQVDRLAPLNAIVLVERDGETFLLWQAQQVAGWRPDLTIINPLLLHHDWYAASLRSLAPDVPLEGAAQAERMQSLYSTSRPLVAPRLLKPPVGLRALPLGEGWYCLTRETQC